jgi:hypothetical protein
VGGASGAAEAAVRGVGFTPAGWPKRSRASVVASAWSFSVSSTEYRRGCPADQGLMRRPPMRALAACLPPAGAWPANVRPAASSGCGVAAQRDGKRAQGQQAADTAMQEEQGHGGCGVSRGCGSRSAAGARRRGRR